MRPAMSTAADLSTTMLILNMEGLCDIIYTLAPEAAAVILSTRPGAATTALPTTEISALSL